MSALAGGAAASNLNDASLPSSTTAMAASTSSSDADAGPSSLSAGSALHPYNPTYSPNSLDTLDGIVSAAESLAQAAAGNAELHAQLVRDQLLPALNALEHKGNSIGMSWADVLQGALSGNRDPLQVLAAHPATLGGAVYLNILIARCIAENANANVLLPYIAGFCEEADGRQLRLHNVSAKVGTLANYIAHFMVAQPQNALSMLFNLLCHYSGDHHTYLNAVCPVFLLVTLRAGVYRDAENILLRFRVTHVDTRAFPITYQDNLKYHLYGGTILATLGHYKIAADFLEAAVCAPTHTNATSLLQVDAYKRLILVQLLLHGKTATLPPYVSGHLVQTFKNLHQSDYLDFAIRYSSSLTSQIERNKLLGFINTPAVRNVFEQDANTGLLERCINAIPDRAIVKLQAVYKTLELEQVARHIGTLIDSPPSEEDAVREHEGSIKSGDLTLQNAANGVAAPASPLLNAADAVTVSVAPQDPQGPVHPLRPASFTNALEAVAFIKICIHSLVLSKQLSGRIVTHQQSSKEYLEFLPSAKTTVESAQALQATFDTLQRAKRTIASLDAQISTSREFISKAYTAASGTRVGGNAMDFDGDAVMQQLMMEEDLITRGEIGGRVDDMDSDEL